MLYGTSLKIPGEFFIEDLPADPEIFVEKHQIHMREIKSQPTAHHHKKTPFYHKNLFDCTHVWIRVDSVKKSLQPPYNGPFRVVNRINNNLFTVDVSGKLTDVSTERLKPVFLPKEVDSDPVTSSSTAPLTTSHGTLKTYSGPRKQVRFAT
ncbi:uncharacterized protein LOC115239589 [Formica exsecta]|uniref:uncharacterized protein LOC115239589 n=1 Tax=Formica exsecta TaxID=72781 RepID=UPI0011415F95|nr:uncharacterized protein LOC115239589 [Formica exsecta]